MATDIIMYNLWGNMIKVPGLFKTSVVCVLNLLCLVLALASQSLVL